ncbi:MAG TPA: dienelactone hydrolase family protein [Verrucomicrobiae bacterium]
MSSKVFAAGRIALFCGALLSWTLPAFSQSAEPLAGTKQLTMEGDLSEQMVTGISKFLDRELAASVEGRARFWKPDFSTRTTYNQSVQPNRERLARIIGAVDARVTKVNLEYVATSTSPAKVAETDRFVAYAVRWPVFENVYGEGLMLVPKGRSSCRVIAIPDADQTPEQIAGLAPGLPTELQFARRFAENGCQVIIPTLASRADTFSGNVRLNRFTNQPHREWIYRQAYELGRHIVGYEVQKVLAAVDWLEGQLPTKDAIPPEVGVVGYGEGGLIAFYSAAIDTRIDACFVSGYFGKREKLWQEPIYRNFHGLLQEFGDAEIATLIAPRVFIAEYSPAPDVKGPPEERAGRKGAAPGKIVTPEYKDVVAEFNRAQMLCAEAFRPALILFNGQDGALMGPINDTGVLATMQALRVNIESLRVPGQQPTDLRPTFNQDERQERLVRDLERHTQRLLLLASSVRDDFLWNKVKPNTTNEWQAAMRSYQTKLWDESIGRFAKGTNELNPRTRKIYDKPKWTGYDVVLDVHNDVYAWGYLLLPKGMKPGEKRPVVVCQHGLEGVPDDVVNDNLESPAYAAYKAFGARLVERGFIVFVPHNPYRGKDAFRVLQRKANPLGKSLFSVILNQHDRILDFLSSQSFVDPQRIGFYGLSYGGKTAMRVPALLDRYCLSICSGDFNEWVWKNVTTDWSRSYMFSGEYEMPEFNLGSTFNYAEMAALIAPRPFMVERGHNDGVGVDEWVAFEYAKVNRLYGKLKIPQLTQIEYFDGPHTINGQASYKFLHKHLNWPEPKQ